MSIARAKPSLRALDHPAVQVLPGRERDRVQHEVEAAPFLLDGGEHRFHLAGLLDVERHGDRCRARQRPTCGRALSFSHVTPRSAPRLRNTRAQPQAMLASFAMPTIKPLRPARTEESSCECETIRQPLSPLPACQRAHAATWSAPA